DARRGALRGLLQSEQALAVFVGKRLEQHGVHDTEDRGVRADAKTQHNDRGDGEAEIFTHHAQRERAILPQHGPMFAWSGGENALRGFPPQAPQAYAVAVPFRVGALVGEDLLHFGAVVTAKLRGKQAQQEAVALDAVAFGSGHELNSFRNLWLSAVG